MQTTLADFSTRVWSSDKVHRYTVRAVAGVLYCTCHGYAHRNRCKHVEAIATLAEAGRARVVGGKLETP